MCVDDLASLPTHLLAASIVRGRERLAVRIQRLSPGRIVLGPAPLALHERALVLIACPLRSMTCEVTAEIVKKTGESTWLALV